MANYEHIHREFPKWRETQNTVPPGIAWERLKHIIDWVAGGLEPDSCLKVMEAKERLDKRNQGAFNPSIADPAGEQDLYYLIGRVCAYLEFDFSPTVFHRAVMAMFSLARMNREIDVDIEDNKRGYGHD